eukprot:snap_masked-scaffold_12-processed-gene-12.51-mRNA-1 protein AED:0.41 eAED:0.41 QI:0/-1/0/1/-1/1/1/0/881
MKFNPIEIKVPAKIILFGEHAVVSGSHCIAAAVNRFLRIRCVCEKRAGSSSNIIVETPLSSNKTFQSILDFFLSNTKYSKVIEEENIILRLSFTKDEMFKISSGMGSSSAVCVGLAAAFLLFENKVTSQTSKRSVQDEIFNLALAAERSINPKCSGVDTAVCVYGKVVDFSKTAGVNQINILQDAKFLVFHTGVKHDCSNILKDVNEDRKALSEKLYVEINKITDGILEDTSIFNDTNQLRKKMFENHVLLAKLGVSCTEADLIAKNVFGAKISGSGRGGILVAPELTSLDLGWMKEVPHVLVDTVTVCNHGVKIIEPELPIYLQRLQLKLASSIEVKENVGHCSAASNIALLKYWGKDLDSLQLPTNPSVSLGLPCFRSFTSVYLSSTPKEEADAFGQDQRVLKFLDMIFPLRKEYENWRLSYISKNNFPSSCGIASSASGFAAIVGAVYDCLNLSKYLDKDDSAYWSTNWSRIGSGSSSRSIYTGIVSWDHQTLCSYPCANLSDLGHLVVVYNPLPKEVSSSKGHKSVRSSLFFQYRDELSHSDFQSFLNYTTPKFKVSPELARLVENDSILMHSVMSTSSPPAEYLTKPAMELVNRFMKFRRSANINAMITFDAGPNPHFIYYKKDETVILNWLKGQYGASATYAYILQSSTLSEHVITKVENRGGLYLGENALKVKEQNDRKSLVIKHQRCYCVMVSGKRYSGKDYVSSEIHKRLISMGFSNSEKFSISHAIKKEYCLQQGINYEEMLEKREIKEKHRENMVRYMKEKMEKDGRFFWDWKLWEETRGGSKLVIVTDARRPNDAEFFNKMTKMVHVRVKASESVRKERGWLPNGVDKEDSECGLDNAKFDLTFSSEGGSNTANLLDDLAQAIVEKLYY